MADGTQVVGNNNDENVTTDRRKSLRASTRKKSQLTNSGSNRKTPKKPLLYLPDDEDDEEDDENENKSEKDEEIIRPRVLQEDTAVAGQEVFGFKTPKRAGSLAQAASEAVHTRTPKISKIKGSSKKGTKKKRVETPTVKNKAPETTSDGKENQNARYPLRRRPLPPPTDDSDDEVSSCDNESVNSYEISGSSGAAANIASTLNRSGDADMTGILEEYFAVHRDAGARVTSDRTLAKLATPRMDPQTLISHVEQVASTHGSEIFQLYCKYRTYFSKWMFQLKNNFNLLLYGLGSKRTVVNQFRKEVLKDSVQVVVNGFFPSLTIKNILNTITEEVLEYDGTFKNVIDQCYYIRNSFAKGEHAQELYLIIHNIDGPTLRARKAQTILSLLAEVQSIYVVATIDHINAPLIWDQTKCSRFNWLWYDVTTFEAYLEETSYENSLLVQQSGALALSSLTHVMRSLTENAKGAFLLIAKHQLDEKDNSACVGLSFHDCFGKCREKFLVNSELSLRAQLTEFMDHKLVKSRKGHDGVEYLYIPVDSATLQQFIEQTEES